jgi:hypothetical protein
MHCSLDFETETVRVTLSYDNVQALYDAMRHLGASSHSTFSLSKRQDDGTTVVVEVNREQGRRDWEGS